MNIPAYNSSMNMRHDHSCTPKSNLICAPPYFMNSREHLSCAGGGRGANESHLLPYNHCVTRAKNTHPFYPDPRHQQQLFVPNSTHTARMPDRQRCNNSMQMGTSYHTLAAPMPPPADAHRFAERRAAAGSTTHAQRFPPSSFCRVMPSHAVDYARNDLTERPHDRSVHMRRVNVDGGHNDTSAMRAPRGALGDVTTSTSSTIRPTRPTTPVEDDKHQVTFFNANFRPLVVVHKGNMAMGGSMAAPREVPELRAPSSIPPALSGVSANNTVGPVTHYHNACRMRHAPWLLHTGPTPMPAAPNPAPRAPWLGWSRSTPELEEGGYAWDANYIYHDNYNNDDYYNNHNNNNKTSNANNSNMGNRRSNRSVMPLSGGYDTAVPHGSLQPPAHDLWGAEAYADTKALCPEVKSMSISGTAGTERRDDRSHRARRECNETSTAYLTRVAAAVANMPVSSTTLACMYAYDRCPPPDYMRSECRNASMLEAAGQRSGDVHARGEAAEGGADVGVCDVPCDAEAPSLSPSSLSVSDAPCLSSEADSHTHSRSYNSPSYLSRCAYHVKHNQLYDRARVNYEGSIHSTHSNSNSDGMLCGHQGVVEGYSYSVRRAMGETNKFLAHHSTTTKLHQSPLNYPLLSSRHMPNLTLFEQSEIQYYLPRVYFTGRASCVKINARRTCHDDGGAANTLGGGTGRSSSSSGSAGVDNKNHGNDGYDDAKAHYRVVMGDHMAYRYEIVEEIGRGTFGIVVKAYDHRDRRMVALKIIKNKASYREQANVEVQLLELLGRDDPDDTTHIVRLLDVFNFRNHFVLVFELLASDLYKFIQARPLMPFSRPFIVRLAQQILIALAFVRDHNILHCDIKPENIMISYDEGSNGDGVVVVDNMQRDANRFDAKLIDFGLSCKQGEQIYTYIQTRYYRAPEVVVGLPCTPAIDMWSFGCVLCELAQGKPIFPASSEGQLLDCMAEYLGPYPEALRNCGQRVHKFYDDNGALKQTMPMLARKTRCKPGQRQIKSFLRASDSKTDTLFVDFIQRCLDYDPDTRMTPRQALQHGWLRTT